MSRLTSRGPVHFRRVLPSSTGRFAAVPVGAGREAQDSLMRAVRVVG